MIIRFFEDPNNQDLLPSTATRPAAALRVGILTIAEKWSHLLKADSIGYLTKDYLQTRFTDVNAHIGRE